MGLWATLVALGVCSFYAPYFMLAVPDLQAVFTWMLRSDLMAWVGHGNVHAEWHDGPYQPPNLLQDLS